MKSLFHLLVLFFAIFIVTPKSTAQIGLGADLVYAFGNKDFATRAHAQYNISDLLAGRFDVTYLFNGIEDVSEIHFKIGPRATHHFTDFFAVHGEVGFVFALVNATAESAFITRKAAGAGIGAGAHYSVSENVDIDVEGLGVLGGPDQLFGSVGFTVWFN